jgi:hypothetical protein
VPFFDPAPPLEAVLFFDPVPAFEAVPFFDPVLVFEAVLFFDPVPVFEAVPFLDPVPAFEVLPFFVDLRPAADCELLPPRWPLEGFFCAAASPEGSRRKKIRRYLSNMRQ